MQIDFAPFRKAKKDPHFCEAFRSAESVAQIRNVSAVLRLLSNALFPIYLGSNQPSGQL